MTTYPTFTDTIPAFHARLLAAKRALEAAGYGCGHLEDDPGMAWFRKPLDPLGFSARIWVRSLPGLARVGRYVLVEQGYGAQYSGWLGGADQWRHQGWLRLANDYPACPQIPGKIALILEQAGLGVLVRPTVREWMNDWVGEELSAIHDAVRTTDQWQTLGELLG